MSDMSNLYRAYSAVHNSEISNQLNESRDLISGMQFNQMNSVDLQEVAEEILEEMFEMSLDINQTSDIITDILSESLELSQSNLKAQKIDSLAEAFDNALENGHTVERFLQYRRSKKVQENFHNISNEELGTKRLHEALIAQNRKNIKEGILSLVEKKVKDSSYLETNMKKRQENNEKARKDMEKMGTSMKNPHFEEVSQIRKDWASSYKSIYEKMDPVGQEDGDIDNDGDEDSSDKYLAKRRKAIGKAMGKKKEKVKEEVDPEKAKKIKKTISNMGKGNPHYDAKSAGSSRVKGFKFTPVKEETENVEDFDQMFDSLIEEGYTKSEALQIMTQMALDEDSRRTSNKQHTQRVRSNIKSFGSNYTPPSNYDPDANRGKGEVLTRKQIEKKRRKSLRQEEVEQYVDFLIDEGYDCSDLTWEDMFEEYESLDEGLRSAVKRLLGKKDAPVEKKPESRGEQLRKKYNVGPERSDTSAKRQILDRTRAKAERDQKQYGGSRYSKSVADKSKAAHDRYLKGGYSKYGADDARGSGNKARKRAEALRNK